MHTYIPHTDMMSRLQGDNDHVESIRIYIKEPPSGAFVDIHSVLLVSKTSSTTDYSDSLCQHRNFTLRGDLSKNIS